MILLAGFLEVLFKALVLIGLASAVGGVVFCLAVLRPVVRDDQYGAQCLKPSLILIACGGGLLAFAQGIILLIEPWALADETGRWPLTQFLVTQFAGASLVHAVLGLCLMAASVWLLKRPASRSGWVAMTVTMVLLMGSGAWLVHAVSQLDHVVPLMAATVIHQCGAAVWAGGVLHLTVLRGFLRGSPRGKSLWPAIVARFSLLAMLSIGTLMVAALYLSIQYIGDREGLIGTAYGAMVLTKAALLAFALCLGGLNFFSVRRWTHTGDASGLSERAPAMIEAEMFIAMIILSAAAALTSQPPAVDQLAERASPVEVLQVFSPKRPQLVPPPPQEILTQATSSFDFLTSPAPHDKVQSNFKHNVSGLLVVFIGIFAMLDRVGKVRFARHWPLLFVLLALFIPLFTEPTGFGNEGFWETLIIPEVLQHRLATLLVAGLGLFEWFVRTGRLAQTRWRFVFPLLCLAGSALMLTHSHNVFAVKSAFLIEISHNAIGILAVGVGVGRWLEVRLPKPSNRLPGFLWTACVILVGFVLFFYREA